MNSQNLPKDKVRELFKSRPGYKFWFLDYSQIELRVGAFYLNDALWLKAFKEGADMHKQTAQIVFGKGEIDEKERAFGKKLNFAMTYGSGVPRVQYLLAEFFGGKKEDYLTKAKQIVTAFRKAHPDLRRLQDMARDRMWDDAKRDSYFTDILEWNTVPDRKADYRGFVQTIYGRRFIIPDDYIYKVVEWLISGTATGDLIKKKFYEVANYLEASGSDGAVVALTHDEIIIELPENEKEVGIVLECKRIMEDEPAITYKVPILVDIKYGYNWGEKVDFKLEAENRQQV